MTGQIVPISLAEAEPILAGAFADDPVFTYFADPSPDRTRDQIYRLLINWIVRFHHLSGQPIHGWQVGGRIIGCALVEVQPTRMRRAIAFVRMLPQTLRLPAASLSRLNDYAARSEQGRPLGVTHFLTLLGVADGARGAGHGGRFLKALHRRYGPTAHWALDTENPANPAFYFRLGYQTYVTEGLGPVTMFKLHRPPTDPTA